MTKKEKALKNILKFYSTEFTVGNKTEGNLEVTYVSVGFLPRRDVRITIADLIPKIKKMYAELSRDLRIHMIKNQADIPEEVDKKTRFIITGDRNPRRPRFVGVLVWIEHYERWVHKWIDTKERWQTNFCVLQPI